METINICGVPHNIIYDNVIDEGSEGIISGKIIHSKCEIHLRKGLTPEYEKETLVHEMVHGILLHLGKAEMCNDEELVQLLACGIYNHFEIRKDICK